jgi:hypothetical protein
VNTNTTLGDDPGDEVTVNAGTVKLLNIPSVSTATEVLVLDGGEVKRSLASGLIGGFAWMLTGNTLSGGEVLGSLNSQPLVLVTGNVERLRVTEAGEVVVQNQDPFGTPTTVLRVLGGNGGAGATRVILQAGANQSGVNLLEWVDNSGAILGVIDADGLVGIGTATPSQRLHVRGNGSVAAVFVNGGIGVGTDNPLATLHIYDERTDPGTGATRVILQAGANQASAGVNLLEWQDYTGTVVLGGIDDAGNLFVNTNTTLGDDPGDEVTVNAGTVKLLNIPSVSTATEVLVLDAGEVKRSPVAAVISGGIIKGSFPITASGSSFTISVAPADIQLGAIVTVTLVGPSGGPIYPLMVTNIDDANDQITVVSSGTIPGGAGYAIHYIIINP